MMSLFHIFLITLPCLPILSIILSFSNFIHTFSISITFQTVKISTVEILHILDVVPFPNLDDLYSILGLSEAKVINARLGGRTPREAEKKVLLLWRSMKDKAATKEVILEAMSELEWKEWENALRVKWGYPEV